MPIAQMVLRASELRDRPKLSFICKEKKEEKEKEKSLKHEVLPRSI